MRPRFGEVAVGFLVPYSTRIGRIASYYARDGLIISIYDTVTLIVIVVLVALIFLTGTDYLSFITGLIVGMLTIQIFFHRFSRILPAEQMPKHPRRRGSSCRTPSRRRRASHGERFC